MNMIDISKLFAKAVTTNTTIGKCRSNEILDLYQELFVPSSGSISVDHDRYAIKKVASIESKNILTVDGMIIKQSMFNRHFYHGIYKFDNNIFIMREMIIDMICNIHSNQLYAAGTLDDFLKSKVSVDAFDKLKSAIDNYIIAYKSFCYLCESEGELTNYCRYLLPPEDELICDDIMGLFAIATIKNIIEYSGDDIFTNNDTLITNSIMMNYLEEPDDTDNFLDMDECDADYIKDAMRRVSVISEVLINEQTDILRDTVCIKKSFEFLNDKKINDTTNTKEDK